MKQSLIFLISCSLAFMSCSGDKDLEPDSNPAPTPNPSAAPVETNASNTNYRPAFTGQTRVNGVTTLARYKVDVVTTSLARPWGISSLPDGRLLVTEKAGLMRIVSNGGNISEPLTGVPQVNSSGQGGLLGVCLDPDFATNRMIYWAFSEPSPAGNQTAIAKGSLSADERALEGVAVIYRAGPAYAGNNHYGARVVFDRMGNLLVSSGERADPGIRQQAQSTDSALGKIIRITTDGQPAPANPFLSQSGVRPELYSMGHRNPQGLAIHPVTGDIWQSEHGPRGGDELNRVLAGANYGWPIITYGIDYGGQPVGSGIQQREGMEQPVYYWDPVVSPGGMTFYSGSRMAEWQNNLFIGCLSGMHIIRLVMENNRVVGEERLLANERQRFRDITQGADGALYAITDGGRLYRIDRD
ncbi:PQQ-dependent sugar dehydrogenase [Pontibacter beigongshangensis]|uniref:PQQ-dependent sugar dehydrogenase n=1 Tax=Pontibacter beigongshangensis TaxID=2574733 RepID=UPI00164FDD63|nr:PQQ-dependent sugar dehydrogenase [Pontibacter beigongshangensis]